MTTAREREGVSMGEREPMSAERLAELRAKVERASALWREDADDLITEIDRLRAEVASVREAVAAHLHVSMAAILDPSVRELSAVLHRAQVAERERDEARAEVAALRDSLRAIADSTGDYSSWVRAMGALDPGAESHAVPDRLVRREPGPRVPDAPGWWWWRPVFDDESTGDWRVEHMEVAPSGVLTARGLSLLRLTDLGEWGGRCEEPRRREREDLVGVLDEVRAELEARGTPIDGPALIAAITEDDER